MKKLYMIELEEITCCGECKFKEKDKSNCPMYNEFSECPLTELKPKELEWEEKYECYLKTTNTNGYDYRLILSNTTEILYCNMPVKWLVNYNAEQVKKACQEHYNTLFYEMLRVKK